ncbi:MAG: tRNA (adenosine(37)-N6)-threonylcarbamoyltransferase complex dimerization subunit type 1 TsaB [Robiginitomaculum sp.]
MICLALDTTGPACSAALVDAANVLGQSSVHIGRGHAEHLAPQVKALLSGVGISPKDISRISVNTGPGSFTGLRVALALAKGMALPANIPVIGISGLQVWAAMADPARERRILSIADVRRGEMFWQTFERGQAVGAPKLGSIEQAKALKCDVAVGNGAKLLGFDDNPRIDPCVLGWLGLGLTPADYPPKPLYHRAPDAKLPGGITPPKLS